MTCSLVFLSVSTSLCRRLARKINFISGNLIASCHDRTSTYYIRDSSVLVTCEGCEELVGSDTEGNCCLRSQYQGKVHSPQFRDFET